MVYASKGAREGLTLALESDGHGARGIRRAGFKAFFFTCYEGG